MFPATLYKMKKRENSTLLPSAQTPSLPIAVNINDGDSSILSPSIRIPTNQPGLAQNANVFDYNYIYIGQFGRYYYITNWVFNGDGTWTAFCHVDVLASWKTDIMASAGYVGRSESFNDPYVQDKFYLAKNNAVTIRDTADTAFHYTPQFGVIVLGVATSTDATLASGTLGGVQYYLMSMAEFTSLMRNLLGIYNSNGVQVFPAWLNKENALFTADTWQSLNNPVEYIISCRYYPGNVFAGLYNTTAEQIVFGGWKAGGLGGHKLTGLAALWPWNSTTSSHYIGEIPISDVGSVGQYNIEYYPRYAPYANYILQTPWGEFELNANEMERIMRRQNPKLYWYMIVNAVTGSATFIVCDTLITTAQAFIPPDRSTVHELIRTEVQLGTDIPLMATFRDDKFMLKAGHGIMNSIFDILGAGLGGAGMGMSMLTGEANISSLGSGMEHAGQSTIQGLKSTADLFFGILDAGAGSQKTAVGNSYADANVTPVINYMTLQQTRYCTVGQAPSMFGKPLKKAVQNLNNYDNRGAFSGYVQMDYTQFEANCTEMERKSVIINLLKGIIIE